MWDDYVTAQDAHLLLFIPTRLHLQQLLSQTLTKNTQGLRLHYPTKIPLAPSNKRRIALACKCPVITRGWQKTKLHSDDSAGLSPGIPNAMWAPKTWNLNKGLTPAAWSPPLHSNVSTMMKEWTVKMVENWTCKTRHIWGYFSGNYMLSRLR